MSSPEPEPGTLAGVAAAQEDLRQAVERFAALHEEARESGADDDLPPFPPGSDVPATSVVVAVNAMLAAVSVDPFELSLWEALGGA